MMLWDEDGEYIPNDAILAKIKEDFPAGAVWAATEPVVAIEARVRNARRLAGEEEVYR